MTAPKKTNIWIPGTDIAVTAFMKGELLEYYNRETGQRETSNRIEVKHWMEEQRRKGKTMLKGDLR